MAGKRRRMSRQSSENLFNAIKGDKSTGPGFRGGRADAVGTAARVNFATRVAKDYSVRATDPRAVVQGEYDRTYRERRRMGMSSEDAAAAASRQAASAARRAASSVPMTKVGTGTNRVQSGREKLANIGVPPSGTIKSGIVSRPADSSVAKYSADAQANLAKQYAANKAMDGTINRLKAAAKTAPTIDPYAAARKMETEFARSKGKNVAAHLAKSGIPPLPGGSRLPADTGLSVKNQMILEAATTSKGGQAPIPGAEPLSWTKTHAGFESTGIKGAAGTVGVALTPRESDAKTALISKERSREMANRKAGTAGGQVGVKYADRILPGEVERQAAEGDKPKRVMSEKQKSSLAKAHDAVRAKHAERKERAAAMGGVGGGGGMGSGGQKHEPAGTPIGGRFAKN